MLLLYKIIGVAVVENGAGVGYICRNQIREIYVQIDLNLPRKNDNYSV